jgi:hypothetical protein
LSSQDEVLDKKVEGDFVESIEVNKAKKTTKSSRSFLGLKDGKS